MTKSVITGSESAHDAIKSHFLPSFLGPIRARGARHHSNTAKYP